MRDILSRVRGLRWKPWAPLVVVALAWWFYAAPTYVAKRIHAGIEAHVNAGIAPIVASRVDFAQVNARMSGDLLRATGGKLDAKSFSHLFLYGWLPQQRSKPEEKAAGDAHQPAPATSSEPARAQYTRLYHIRYKGLNRLMAIYWDPTQTHEIVLTLERDTIVHRWRVTKVYQYNVCYWDFDCKPHTVADHLRK